MQVEDKFYSSINEMELNQKTNYFKKNFCFKGSLFPLSPKICLIKWWIHIGKQFSSWSVFDNIDSFQGIFSIKNVEI